ncbi:MAG: hypothetical protein AAFX99_01985 [Myxococcota bacterium]
MANTKYTTYLDEALLYWLKNNSRLTNRKMPELFNKAIELLREKEIAEEIGCMAPDGKVFIKVPGQDFPDHLEEGETLGAGRPPGS